jgi:hypothetical protein
MTKTKHELEVKPTLHKNKPTSAIEEDDDEYEDDYEDDDDEE